MKFAGHILDRAKPNDVSQAGIARTFQNPALFSEMSILENVLVGLHHTFRVGLFGIVQLSRRRAWSRWHVIPHHEMK